MIYTYDINTYHHPLYSCFYLKNKNKNKLFHEHKHPSGLWSGFLLSNRNVHVVSLVHALIIIPLSLRCLNSPVLDADRAFGWDPRVGTLASIACGYFAWDTFESLWHFSDIGFVVHGKSRSSSIFAHLTKFTDSFFCIFDRLGLLLHILPRICMF